MHKIITLSLLMAFAGTTGVFAQKDSIKTASRETIEIPYTSISKDRMVGAVDVIKGDDVRKSTEYRTNSALTGLASGLFVEKFGGDPGSNGASLKIRGRSRGGDDGPMIVVDGVPHRSLYDVPLEAIESIAVLKDVTAKMLYGPSAADGVIMVTTKRGYNAPRKISFVVDGGIKAPTALPEYLNSAQYAELYNKARANDGLTPFYSQEEIDHFKNGTSPRMYPNEDFYNIFVKDFTNYQRINAMLQGGDKATQYYLNLEYVREEGLEKVGHQNIYNQLNLTSNLDYQVNDVIKVSLDLGTEMGLRDRSNITGNQFFSALSSHRPSDYPIFVSMQGHNPDSLGWSPVNGQTNLYGDLARSGYAKVEDFTAQTALNFDFDFNKYVKGLSANMGISFDAYNTITMGKSLTYSSYKIAREDSLVKVGTDKITGDESKLGDDFTTRFNTNAQVNYNRQFGKHALLANLIFNYSTVGFKTIQDGSATQQDDKSVNFGMRLNYAFNNKYVLEGSSSLMGSDRFERGNRYGLFGAVGAGWILSNEDFMQDGLFDHLKLKASYGVMGYDNSFDYFIHRDEFGGGGAFRFGINNSALPVVYGQKVSQLGNANITFEKSKELNIGVEGRLLNNALSFEVNYFNELRYDMPVVVDTEIPFYVSNTFPTVNYNEVSNKGVDLSLQYNKSIGDLNLSLGGNLMYARSMYEKYSELNVYEHLNQTGKTTDVIWGWVYDGVYADEQDVIDYGVASNYGEIKPGDLKLKDITNDLGDNVIDTYDRTEIGHSFPRINYALNMNLSYKGFDFYLLGQGVADVDQMLNNSYYFNYGERKYSTQALRSDYPRLTTYSNNHSYRNSSYWMENGAYFKLRTAQLSYTLPEFVAEKIKSDKITLYVKGTDLFSISKIKDLDPEDMNGGVTKYPLYTTITLGAKVVF